MFFYIFFTKIEELVGCGDPGVPVHGYKIGDNYWAGEMVTFACDTGYHLEGPTNRLCLENGNWSNVVPTCKKVLHTDSGKKTIITDENISETLYELQIECTVKKKKQ